MRRGQIASRRQLRSCSSAVCARPKVAAHAAPAPPRRGRVVTGIHLTGGDHFPNVPAMMIALNICVLPQLA
jgi:hypothetical protein